VSDLATDERFSTNPRRVTNRDLLWPIVTRVLKTRDRDDWTARLRQAAVPCGPVRTIGEMMTDPQLEARGMIVSIRHPAAGDLRLMGNPVKVSNAPSVEDTPAPLLGQHTEAILTKELGIGPDELRDLRHRGVV
jgi:crotonobetainyl-CoA:carnitine CoA-transferase CaiB-like acyl-CoA transferase